MTEHAAEADSPQTGVAFPVAAAGRRSTSALGRAVVADALRRADPAGALGAERETNWRSGYLTHFRRLVEAGLASSEAALAIAADGLAALHQRMRVVGSDGEASAESLMSASASLTLRTVALTGAGEPERELAVPYRGDRLAGDGLARRLDAWVGTGVIEPSCAHAVREVVAHPHWLSLPGRTVVALGAGSEIGPLPVLLRWGATVAAVDLPRRPLWERVLRATRDGAGTLLVPVAAVDGAANSDERGDGEQDHDARSVGSDPEGAVLAAAGLDLTSEVPELAGWLAGLEGPLVIGNYVYADGEANVRVCVAADLLTRRLQAARDDVALAFLATPTDVFAVPGEAVAQSVRAYERRPTAAKLAGRPLRALSGGRLLRRAYVPGAEPGVCDSLVAQQGPNYALAKRLQRWRAAVARDGGAAVSLNVAPPTRTRSVVKNRVLAAAYAGAHRFGVEVFEPDTCRALMAALLVHDLCADHKPARPLPWQDEADGAAHGGLWRMAYAPRSALGLAALLGYGAART